MLHCSSGIALLGSPCNRSACRILKLNEASLKDTLVTYLEVEDRPAGIRAGRLADFAGQKNALAGAAQARPGRRRGLLLNGLLKGRLHIRRDHCGTPDDGPVYDFFELLALDQGYHPIFVF